MATNYAQKLQREKQSPKGNLLGGLAYGSKRVNTDTGRMKTAKNIVKAPGRFLIGQIEKDLNFKSEMAKPKTPKQIKAAQYKPNK